MDCFAIFDEPRRPWLDADALKEKFHTLTAAHHPDVARAKKNREIDFTALNTAYNTLRDPRARLRHLLELESPHELKRPQQIPSALADLFMRIGALRQRLDGFLKKQGEAASPLAAALLAPEKFSLRDEIEKQLAAAEKHHTALIEEIRALDAKWKAEKSLARLAEIYLSLSFVAKWSEQLRESLVKLSV